MKLIHLTDTHLVLPGLQLYGLDPALRLKAAVSSINASHGDADLAVITGDLTHWGEAGAYVAFRDAMAQLKMPYTVLVGNHDRRATCLEILQHAPRDADGFVQGFQDTPEGRLIFLDTLDEASHAGQLCNKRLAWLHYALASAKPDVPFFIFMHHPPFAVGIHDMDRIALAQSDAFHQIAAPFLPRFRHLFFGHVHRPISGSWQGVPFSTLRGTNHQVWFDLSDGCPHLASHEPPAYGVVLISPASVIVHTHDFLETGPRFLFSKPGEDERAYQLGPLQPVA